MYKLAIFHHTNSCAFIESFAALKKAFGGDRSECFFIDLPVVPREKETIEITSGKKTWHLTVKHVRHTYVDLGGIKYLGLITDTRIFVEIDFPSPHTYDT